MCYYITLTLPNDKELEKVREILYNYNMIFYQINNKSIKSYLKAGQLNFRPTTEYCDCDTALGVFNRQNEYEKLLPSKKVRNLKKKKWTQEQIDKWIWEKLNNEEIVLKRTEKVNLNDINQDFLLYIEEDVLYEFFIPLKY